MTPHIQLCVSKALKQMLGCCAGYVASNQRDWGLASSPRCRWQGSDQLFEHVQL